MGAAIKLRDDFTGAMLRDLAKRSRDGAQSRRLIALAEVCDGARRSEAARLAGVGLQIIRDWVLRFNAAGPDGLIDRKSPGPQRKLTDEQRAGLVRQVERGPIPAIHGVIRWRRSDLAQWLWEEYGVSLDVTTVGRELRRLGFAKLSARPRHYAQNEFAVEAFKKTSPPS